MTLSPFEHSAPDRFHPSRRSFARIVLKTIKNRSLFRDSTKFHSIPIKRNPECGECRVLEPYLHICKTVSLRSVRFIGARKFASSSVGNEHNLFCFAGNGTGRVGSSFIKRLVPGAKQSDASIFALMKHENLEEIAWGSPDLSDYHARRVYRGKQSKATSRWQIPN